MSEKRETNRNACFIRGEAVLPDGKRRVPVTVHDISETGAKVVPVADGELPDFLVLDLPRRGLTEPVRVMRRGESDLGVAFINKKET